MKYRFKPLIFGVAIAIACIALSKMCYQVIGVLRSVNWVWVLLATTGLTLYQWLNASIWKDVIAGIGGKVSRGHAMRIWIQSESMKWLPGGIWGYGSRVMNARLLGISPQLASASLAIELLLTITAWAATVIWILPTRVGRDTIDRIAVGLEGIPAMAWSIPAGAVCITVWIGLTKFELKRLPLIGGLVGSCGSMDWEPKWLVRSAFFYGGLCVLNGSLLWLVTCAVPGLVVPWGTTIGIGGLAWLAGFFAIGVPGGIGVREAVLAGLLHRFGPMEAAVTAAVIFRASQVTAELVAVTASLVYGWRENKNALAINEPSVIS